MTVVVRYHGHMSNAEAPVQPEKEARKAVADWFLEVSALLAVFPWLDQLVFHPKGTFDWPLTWATTIGALGLAFLGLSLLMESRRLRIPIRLASCVLLVLAFVIFFLR